MIKINKRWEVGSEFHCLDYSVHKNDVLPWDKCNYYYFGSGRDSLRSIIRNIKCRNKSFTLWLPEYFCQEVVLDLLREGIEIKFYPLDPESMKSDVSSINIKKNDAIMLINLFGIKFFDEYDNIPTNVFIIENHTHDPFSFYAYNSKAHYCFASLRKTLPIPCGIVWSQNMINEVENYKITKIRHKAISDKLIAMQLKSLYLKGFDLSKDIYRTIEIKAEKNMGRGNISLAPAWVESIVNSFPILNCREKRKNNYIKFLGYLDDKIKENILLPKDINRTYPFMIIMLLRTKTERDKVRKMLIENNIFPAILWKPSKHKLFSTKNYEERHNAFSDRMLAIHCDMRYDHKDMRKVADILGKIYKRLQKR